MQEGIDRVAVFRSTKIIPPTGQSLCSTHNLSQEHICLIPTCKLYLQPKCQECFQLNNHYHKATNINRIGPMLVKWLCDQWKNNKKENAAIEKEWKNCEQYINQSIKNLEKLKAAVEKRKVNDYPIFDNLVKNTQQIISGDLNCDDFLKKIKKLNEQYGVLHGGNIDSDCLEQEKKQRKLKWSNLATKLKKYVDDGTNFQANIGKSLKEAYKYERKNKKMDKENEERTFTVAELAINSKAKLQKICNLKIQITSKKDSDQTEPILKKCTNLKSLTINNKNGKLDEKTLLAIASHIQHTLKKLKELKLTLNFDDLIKVNKFFYEDPSPVDNLQVLYLSVSDQPNFDMKIAAEFCNRFRFEEIHLAFTRDNITGMNFKQFIDMFTSHQSKEKNSVNELYINLSKNCIQSLSDVSYCETNFNVKCENIRTKKLVL